MQSQTALSKDALVVVADGHSALFLRNRAKNGVQLEETRRMSQKDLVDGELLENSSDDVSEKDFAARLTNHLNGLILKQKADEVVIIADPQTLGAMRKKYHKELQQRLTREISKSLTNADLRSIEAALA